MWRMGLFLMLAAGLWAQKQEPVHGPDFKMECALCHTTESWRVDPARVRFNHGAAGYALLGAHRRTACRSCHQSLIFSHIGHNCVDCHDDIHQGEMGIDCERCHNPQSWENRLEMFDLHQNTRFPLLGVHAQVDCQSCHNSSDHRDYKLKALECRQCHLQNYLQTLNPAHQKSGFDLNCQTCHPVNAASWQQTVYRHSPNFPLSGGHSGIDCMDCHSAGYQNTSPECYACHQSDYERAANPNHRAFGFPTVCQECHSSQSWARSQFDHLAVSGFALNGAHADAVLCVDCHVNNQLSGLPTDCYGCHQNAYNQTSDPNHVSGNFPHDCLSCHNEEAWSPATFDHNLTDFPLSGAHQTVACLQCHQNGYSNTPPECVACHRQDYDNTNNPAHQAANFPVTCQDCHSTVAWQPANWDHDGQYFPIYSGKHQGEWSTCADCHENSSDYRQFTCLSCHEHNQTKMDDEHKEVGGYVYQSQACYDCHPNGTKEEGDD